MAIDYSGREQIWKGICDVLHWTSPFMKAPEGIPLGSKAGAPNEVARHGTLCLDTTNDDVYFDADGAADWNKLNA